MPDLDIERLFSRMREFDALRDQGDDKDKLDQVTRGSLDRIEPEYEDCWPEKVHPDVRAALESGGFTTPYKHQADAVRKSLEGADVVIESPTASGKTLSFAVPMLDTLVRDHNAHALLIYPMKALAMDQREQIDTLCRHLPEGGRKIQSWPYDGNTDKEHRDIIRQDPPPILMTNPEYLSMSFLAWKEKWNGFLQNLRYIIIDEMHEYRGFFGANMALLLRRFLLQLERLGVSPQIIMSTATCANPREHAETLTGREMELISARNCIRPKREFIFINPSIPDYQYRDIFRLRIERAALTYLSEGLCALIFCPSKKFAEEAFKNCLRSAVEHDLDKEKLSLFHADLSAEKRLEIQAGIKCGDIHVAFTSNALELGLDIGGLDGVILAGFPAHIMSAWQQIGRAGRGWNKDAVVLFYAMNDPIDQFFVGNLDAFLDKPFDQLVVDPGNEEVIKNHLPSLSQETGCSLHEKDIEILGASFYNKANENMGSVLNTGNYRPQNHLKIRGDIGSSFALKRGSESVGQISGARRFREAYIGAHFSFFGQTYKVRSHEEDAVVLAEPPENERNCKTEPSFYTTVTVSDVFRGVKFGGIMNIHHGKLNINTNFSGYKLVDSHGVVRDSGGAPGALNQSNLHAFWISVEDDSYANGIGALEQLIRVGAMFVIPADRFDAGTFSRRTANDLTAFYYENHAGGIGIAKNLFSVWKDTLAAGVKVAQQCSCTSGCANCIEPPKFYVNAEIDKRRGIELAEKILAAEQEGFTHSLRDGMWEPV